MVHQNFMLVPSMTVAENVALGLRHLHRRFRLDLAEARRRVVEVSEHHQLPVSPDVPVWQLSVGEQQRVELVKTLCLGARVLILDEPTSALTPQETDDLLERLGRMTAELPIIFISHKLNEVKTLSHRVTILRRGAVVFTGDTGDHSTAELAALMTGREVHQPRNAGGEPGAPVLSVRGLQVRGDRGHLAVDGLDLALRAGEILGLAGVSGNGQRELADALAGLRADGGRERAARPRGPGRGAAAPDHRARDGLRPRGPAPRGDRPGLLGQGEPGAEGRGLGRASAPAPSSGSAPSTGTPPSCAIGSTSAAPPPRSRPAPSPAATSRR